MSISRNLLKISGSHFGKPTPIVSELKTCLYLNISSCQYSESWDSFVVNVYNPLGRQVDRYIRLPVKRDKVYTVQDHAGLSFFFPSKPGFCNPSVAILLANNRFDIPMFISSVIILFSAVVKVQDPCAVGLRFKIYCLVSFHVQIRFMF